MLDAKYRLLPKTWEAALRTVLDVFILMIYFLISNMMLSP